MLAPRSSETRYRIGLLGLLAMAAAPVVTFCYLMPALPHDLAPNDAADVSEQHLEKAVLLSLKIQPPAPAPTSVVLEPKASESYSAWVISGWSIGVLLFGARLLSGFIGLYRWSWPRKPISPDISEIAQRLAKKLGMHMPRIFLSPKVPEALALGIIRPLILIPTAWVMELPLPMMEAVLAHELRIFGVTICGSISCNDL